MNPAILSMLGNSVPNNSDMFNAFSTMATNVMQQRWAERMYSRQYDDSIEFWNMQNAYNSPQAQMERFKAAGLNPNLIYGQGNSGNATPPNVPSLTGVDMKAPQLPSQAPDLLATLLQSADLEMKQAQTENVEAQNEVIRQNALLTALKAKRAGFDLGVEEELRGTSLEFRKEQLRKTTIENDVLINRDAREAAMNASNLSEAIERMMNMKEQRLSMQLERVRTREDIERIKADTDRTRENIKLLEQQGIINKLDIELKEIGLNPNSPFYATVLGRLANLIQGDLPDISDIKGSLIKWLISHTVAAGN